MKTVFFIFKECGSFSLNMYTGKITDLTAKITDLTPVNVGFRKKNRGNLPRGMYFDSSPVYLPG